MRVVLHDWHDNCAINILKQIRKSCHESSRVLIADCMMLPAIPTRLEDCNSQGSFEEVLNDVSNISISPSHAVMSFLQSLISLQPYQLMPAPYPLPQNFGFATKAQNLFDVAMLVVVNALERTSPQFEKVLAESGFKINKVSSTRGTATSTPNLGRFPT
ncbi:hypothetical protein BD310DRAFT_239391 [Dichomitus squalens]|uniref:O-methyltransferase C-terminal domain-containing protein n=1 Tax=Dichomitus squalens TaxID=114155 RepID=A0A4Q9Q1S3_9APHY|nr:hypothetical protein BD310DRAFT_239391 [Dichomitus squalens]